LGSAAGGLEEIKTGAGDPYRVYGPFRRNWFGQVEQKAASGELATRPAPSGLLDWEGDLPGLGPGEGTGLSSGPLRVLAQLPTAAVFWEGLWRVPISAPVGPAKRRPREQLRDFCDGGALLSYEPGRNLPGQAGTSALGAALALGTLSPARPGRRPSSQELAGEQEQLESIQVWEQELAWREFYQQALFHFPELADGPYRPQWRHFPWDNNQDHFEAWCEGLTGMPIIDAAMRQLNRSGWMHNRCRMIVASYLVKDLICDWRWGESAFMQRLVDGDLAGRQRRLAMEMPAAAWTQNRLRIFNPATQASKFDPEGDYIRRWLPELRHVCNRDLISGESRRWSAGDTRSRS
jgi:deoxyribodipyrimidine photo-lyase